MNQATNINERLKTLPSKTAAPFRQLLAAGQLDEDVLSAILDAGELAQDPSRLLGFAIGFSYLRSQGIPILDVIRMAKQQQRRINLAWTVKRWKQEHERLSRAEALDRLAKENIQYDVSKFAQFLPKNYDGYLIRTSRRLGMEGLRQRHCVASYHNEIRAGRTAIASILVDKQRWTVQLFPTENPEHPLRIAQIKTRYNALPPAKVREAIFNMLKIDPNPHREATSIPTGDRHKYMQTLQRLLPVLQRHGVQEIMVEFDGSGDSGSIEHISYNSSELFDAQAVTIQHEISQCYLENGQWVTTREQAQKSVAEIIEELTYDYLEETDIDWYNNDGGYGNLMINVEKETVALEVNVRYTESTNEFCSERDITTGEEI